VSAADLTLERLFAAPPLSGPVAGAIRYAPDGRRVAYLRPGEDDPERLDLWLHDLDRDEARRVADARDLAGGPGLAETRSEALSEEERARRERTRTFAHGIVELRWSPRGDALLFPFGGRIYRLPLAGPMPREPATPITPEHLFATDIACAPQGDALAFVAEGDLWLLDPALGAEPRRLTHEGSETVTCGLAEFIAAEEMHRHEGYWFSPDGARIAFTRVDTAPVPLTHRYEIDAEGAGARPQRYPFAGGPNARVDLEVIELADGARHRIPWTDPPAETTSRSDAEDAYLARVSWLPDGRHLAIQRQSRDQRALELVVHDTQGRSEPRVVLRECSATWVNLHDNLHFLSGATNDAGEALWTSERDGTSRLYRLALVDGVLTALTPNQAMVERVLGVDERAGRAYFQGWTERPVERHLYAVGLDGIAPPQRLTTAGGWHQCTLAPDHRSFVDRVTRLAAPPALHLQHLSGIAPGAAGSALALLANALNEAHPYHPYLAEHAPSELGTLAADDGQQLWYRLTRPADFDAARRYPVLVCVYGGPGVQRVMDAWPPPTQQYFARRGWVVFELDNRGTAGRGPAFEAPIHGRLGEVEVADQARGVAWLSEQPWVDPGRIAVFGHSYGGYMALMCLARRPELFRAAIAVAPVTDWRLYDTHYTERYLGDPAKNAAAYAASCVLSHLEGLRGRLLLMHGMADDNVLFTHSTRLMQALQEQGVQFELMTYPGARHGLAGRGVSVHRYRLMVDFLERELGGPA